MNIDTKFKKGHKINIGRVFSEETRKKMSETHKKIGTGEWMKGKKLTEETKKRISESLKGHLGYWLGKKRLLETKLKISKANSGENSYLWRGGITSASIKIRHSFEMRQWREAVFARDNFTCLWCGQRGGELNADHIKPFALFPELRFELSNGRTLCIDCHRKTETYLNNRKKAELLSCNII